MGVRIELFVNPEAIDAGAWAQAYDETVAMLEAWHPPLLGWGVRNFEDVRVSVLTRSIREPAEDPDQQAWVIVGDRDSLMFAECQRVRRDVSHYRGHKTHKTHKTHKDVVLTVANPAWESKDGLVRVFDGKTQGHPYHFAVLAAGMVFEDRLAGHAIVLGDIDRGQAQNARDMAKGILGRELALPVLVDAPRLLERLRAGYDEAAMPAAFHRAYLGEDDVCEAMLRAFPGDAGACEWLRALKEHEQPDTVGVSQLIIAWLNAGRDVRTACRLACLAPEGPRWSPEHFVDALASTWAAVPREAREQLDVLRKPEGESYTVASLFCSFLLDAGATGRGLRIEIPQTELAAALTAAFGERGSKLATRLSKKSQRAEKDLRKASLGLKRFLDQAVEAAPDDAETLASVGTVGGMSEAQRQWVRCLAWHVAQAAEQLRNDPKLNAIVGDATIAKRTLLRTLSRGGLLLTEDAWDAVTAESDTETLRWWLALSTLQADDVRAHQVRRALFENAELRDYAIALGRDPTEMDAIGQFVAKASSASRA